MIYYSIQEKLTCSRIHSSTSADGWILPARHRCWRGTDAVSFCLRRLRRLLPGAGGHRAVGLRPLANRGAAAPAAPDRGPGLLPHVHRAGEPSAGAAAGPREGGAEQLPLPHRGPLRHPRRRTAGPAPSTRWHRRSAGERGR